MQNIPPPDQPSSQGNESSPPPPYGYPPPPGQPPYGGYNPPPGQPYGAPPPGAGQPYGAPPPGYGTPPPGQPYGAPPPGYGAPPPGQPYGAPPPGYNNYGAPPRPPKRGLPWWGWLLIALPILAIVGCVGVVGLGVGAAVSVKTDGDKALAQFMQAAAANNLDQMASLYYKPGASSQAIKQELQQQLLNPTRGYISDYSNVNSNGFSYNTVNGRETLSLSGTMDYKTKGKGTFQATMVKVNGQWIVNELTLDPPS